MKKSIKKSVKKDKRQFWEERAKAMEEAQNQGKAREVFEEVSKMRGKRKSGVERMRDKKGEMKSDTTQVAECITDYFQKLFNVDAKVDNDMEVPKVEGTEERWKDLEEAPSEEEVAEKIRKLKNFKAGGPDDITAEAIKWACEEKRALSEMHDLLGEIWRTGEVPKEWGESVMVPLLKKGDPTNCDNYRGIALLSICGKVLTRIIADRIQKGYNDQMMEAQCGFRGGRSTTDQMFTLRQVVERRREYGLRSFAAFVDLKKAYDSVPRKLLFKVLRAEGIPEVMVRILESLYSKTTGRVRVKGMLGAEFDLRTGVRQGCVISPLLFNIYLNHILKRAERELKEKGLQFAFHIGRKLGPSGDPNAETLSVWGTLYADDIALLATSKENLQEMLTTIDTEFTRYGMTISAEKTKVMMCGDKKPDEPVDAMNIKIGDQKLEEVQSFKYVGGIITADGEMKEEIDQRMKTASMAFGGLRSKLFNNKKMAKGVKIRVYESLILAILLYGSETWNVRTTETKKLETFHMNCLRCIAGKSRHEKIRNAIIRKSLKQTTILSNMRRRRLRWLGHVRRMDDGRWQKQIMYSWIKDCPRPKGKPKQRWRDVVNRDLKALGLKERWYELATQRGEWRAAIHKREQARFEEEERKEAEKIREFACINCGKKCKSEKGLKGHMTRVHPFMCQKCGAEFDNHKSLSCHQATCKEQKKEKEKEENDEEWEYHGKRKQKEKPPSSSSPDLPPTEFRCSLCKDFVAKNLTGLKSHLKHKHPDGKPTLDLPSSSPSLSSSSSPSVSQPPSPPPPPAQSKNFQCHFCSFTCAAKIGIWKHEQTQHQPSPTATSSSSPPAPLDILSLTTSTPTSDLLVPSSLTKGPSPVHRPPDDDSPPG